MKKQRRKPQSGRKRTASASAPPDSGAPTDAAIGRRRALARIRNYGIAAAVLTGGGWYLVTDYNKAKAEQDLARIGNGIPAVVQVHDPQCPTCRSLQREARAAFGGFGEGELQYLVANIRNPAGRDFAARNDVGKITLMIFDGNGTRRLMLEGPNSRENLERIFTRFAKQPKPDEKGQPTS